MKKWNVTVFWFLMFFLLNEYRIYISCTSVIKQPFDRWETDVKHQSNINNANSSSNNSSISISSNSKKNSIVASKLESLNYNEHENESLSLLCNSVNKSNVYPVVVDERMANDDIVNFKENVMQLDQPEKVFRTPQQKQQHQQHQLTYSYGNIRRQPSQMTHHNFHRRDDINIEYTKEVVIKQGQLKGLVRTMHAQSGLKNVNQFLGIPYAAAPVGNGRFMPPGAPPPWHGLKLTTTLSPVCPQNSPSLNNSNHLLSSGRYDQLKRLLPFLRDENEDCLFLNVYVPKWENIGPSPKYPVIIYIHGESYEWNSGNPYDGSVLASYGQVIVVTLNYRLGILGFLKPGTTDHTVSNFGLLDQIAALQWVKDNIGAFGGDNKVVTLMGHGTGAACVNLLMVSPVARGLFHRAILMSGSALSDWAIANHPLQTTMQVVQGLNCPLRDDHEELLSCLRKKRYQEILKSRISTPEFSTTFGPVVDNLVVPNQPNKIMSQYNGVFSRYDMLFGMTEIESYHNLNAIGLQHGLLESERDNYLRFFMQNRFELRPDIAMALTLQEYTDIYNNPERPLAEEHRDTVLEILSDARVASPLIQTGLYHAKVNPRSYMYVFAHNSKAGEFASLPQSVVGEDLPYVFGAPLASAGPFQSRYSPEERLLSEAIMVYWTNFAKTGNPKAPWRESFLNLDPREWERYDIDWPEFNSVTLNYLNIGIPPVVNQKYKWKYMNFWNQYLPDELNRTLSQKPIQPYPELYAPNPVQYPRNDMTKSLNPSDAKINYYSDKTTEDPFRTLKYLLNRPSLNRTDVYNTQPSLVTTVSDDTVENVIPDNQVIVKADATLNILIAIVIIFLIVNILIIFVYLIRRNYFDKTLKRKLDILSLDGTTDDDLKRSKTNDGDESLTIEIARKKNEYEPIRRNRSPINGFLLSRELSTSTMDAHTKVCDWMSKEILKQSPKDKKKFSSPSFSLGTKSFFKKPDKVSVAIDATPNARSPSILRQEPAELMKSTTTYELDNKDLIICQEIDIDSSLIDSVNLRNSDSRPRRNSINSLKGAADIIKIDHKHSRSDPVQMYYRKQQPDEEITVFIKDINVTSRDGHNIERNPLTPEEALKTIQMRNYPKVLPNYPNGEQDYVPMSIKRRSLPPQSFLINPHLKIPPAPPPRTTSTLGRNISLRRDSKNLTTSPLKMADEPPIEEEPQITCNILHVGPIIPNSNESLYSTIKRQQQQQQSCIIENSKSTDKKQQSFNFENTITVEQYPIGKVNIEPRPGEGQTVKLIGIKPPTGYQKFNNLQPVQKDTGKFIEKRSIGPKVIIKPTLCRQNSGDKNSSIPRVQAPIDLSSKQSIISKIPVTTASLERNHSTSDSSSSDASSSTATTIKQLF